MVIEMKECPICGDFPVIKGSGFCMKHHKQFTKAKRRFKKSFIEYRKL
jgi:hypothetical protein